MIRNFRDIGKDVLKRNIYYQTNQEIERRKIFLFHQSMIPFKKRREIKRAIVLNFNLNRNEFFFELDMELDAPYWEYYYTSK
jgi:hypothetical protein